jgi:hypothetical protein
MTEGSKVVTMEMLTAGETLPVLVLRPTRSHTVRNSDALTDTQRVSSQFQRIEQKN